MDVDRPWRDEDWSSATRSSNSRRVSSTSVPWTVQRRPTRSTATLPTRTSPAGPSTSVPRLRRRWALTRATTSGAENGLTT